MIGIGIRASQSCYGPESLDNMTDKQYKSGGGGS